MKEFIEYVIKRLVDKPDEVNVREVIAEHTCIYEVRVGDGDMGKVIGRKGLHVSSLRVLLAAMAGKRGKRCVLELLEGDGTRQNP